MRVMSLEEKPIDVSFRGTPSTRAFHRIPLPHLRISEAKAAFRDILESRFLHSLESSFINALESIFLDNMERRFLICVHLSAAGVS
jgi:hypothetical protein